MIKLELATMDELAVYIDILRSARDFQREQGFVQWTDGFPSEELIKGDIENKNGYVLRVDGEAAGYMYIGFDGDAEYPRIVGAWHTGEKYAVIHRIGIAGGFRGVGLSRAAFDLAGELCRERGFYDLRIDTHEDNKRMQHVLEKNGFSYCGTVMQNGGERMAYDKKL